MICVDQDTKFTSETIERLFSTPCGNILNKDSNLYCVWDAGIDMLIPHMANEHNFSYIRPMPPTQRDAELQQVHYTINEIKDKIANNIQGNPNLLPGKEEFREACCRMYHILNSDHPIGKFYRDIISRTFEVLELEPIKEIAELRPPRTTNTTRT